MAKLQRIHIHWTGGADGIIELEKDSYNYLIDRKGNTWSGLHAPERQLPPLVKGRYAAHTLNANSNAIGVALDAMGGAVEVPFNAGKYPITEVQVEAACKFVAQLCQKYGIEVTRKTVLTHAEVERTLGIKQNNKWDIVWLPHMKKPADAIVVGDYLRDKIRGYLR